MGSIREVTPAALICALTWRDEHVRGEAVARLTEQYGPIQMESAVYPFDMTDYYTPEMGPGLLKHFICFRNPIEQDGLAEVKLFANGLESEFAIDCDGSHARRINIDPGYVTLAKLVLASTKDYSHRIYIGGGIYAESTLRYSKATFHPTDTTFPDYCTPLAIAFFNEVRDYVKRERGRWTTHTVL